MKNVLIIICSIILFCAAPANTFAGFRVKKAAVTSETGATVTNMPAPSPALSKKEQRREAVKALKNIVLHENDGPHRHNHRRGSNSGWEGIVALVCGILGLVTGWLAIPAIIFGAIGMGRGHVHRGMALAGFIMGVVVVAIAILLIVLFTSVYGL